MIKKAHLMRNSEEMLVAKRLVEIGTERKRAETKGWVCGTYISSLRTSLAEMLHLKYADNTPLKMLCRKWKLYETENEDIAAELADIDIEKIEEEILKLVPNVRINPGGLG